MHERINSWWYVSVIHTLHKQHTLHNEFITSWSDIQGYRKTSDHCIYATGTILLLRDNWTCLSVIALCCLLSLQKIYYKENHPIYKRIPMHEQINTRVNVLVFSTVEPGLFPWVWEIFLFVGSYKKKLLFFHCIYATGTILLLRDNWTCLSVIALCCLLSLQKIYYKENHH
jgi:hypothetical protein